MILAREKSSRSDDLFGAPRDEKNRQVCLIAEKEVK